MSKNELHLIYGGIIAVLVYYIWVRVVTPALNNAGSATINQTESDAESNAQGALAGLENSFNDF